MIPGPRDAAVIPGRALTRRRLPGARAAFVAAFVLAGFSPQACAGSDSAGPPPPDECRALGGPPYPASEVVRGIEWDFGGLVRLAPGSDLWPTTWASDGDVHTAWGDGGGFGGTEADGRVSLGFGRIGGSPPAIEPRNVWGGKDPIRPATFGGKATGMLSAGGTLYAWILEQPSAAPTPVRAASSSDLGRTWELPERAFPAQRGAFYPTTFLNYGRDYAGAPDAFAYAYGKRWAGGPDPFAGTDAYLARAPLGRVADPGAYEFFAGLDAGCRPRWAGALASAVPVVSDPSGIDAPHVVHVPALGRYLATTARAQQVGRLTILEAPDPWGPWRTVAAYDDWGGFGTSQSLGYSIPAKWISADARSLWMVFSASGALDSFNLVRATLAPPGP